VRMPGETDGPLTLLSRPNGRLDLAPLRGRLRADFDALRVRGRDGRPLPTRLRSVCTVTIGSEKPLLSSDRDPPARRAGLGVPPAARESLDEGRHGARHGGGPAASRARPAAEASWRGGRLVSRTSRRTALRVRSRSPSAGTRPGAVARGWHSSPMDGAAASAAPWLMAVTARAQGRTVSHAKRMNLLSIRE